MKHLLALSVLVAAACGGKSNPPSPDAGMTDDPNTVTIAQGQVHGSTNGALRSWQGIPYAAPPVGPLRFAAPAAPAAFTGVFDATKFGAHCPQQSSPFSTGTNISEDCLFVNVFTPTTAPPAGGFPVMFWIHGGAFALGESDDYGPAALVAEGVIVVSINYRLGILGFLAHPALTAEQGGSSGNYGLMDQQAALAWVQTNIAAFGGDKTNVTIFGESAGGFSVHAHLVSAGSAGLFAKAIIESGAYGNTLQQSLTDAENVGFATCPSQSCSGVALATASGCPTGCTADQLRGLALAKILMAQAVVPTWIPHIDGKVFTTSIAASLTAGTFAKVPLIEGSNHDEYRLFVAVDEVDTLLTTGTDTPLSDAAYPAAVGAAFGATAEQLTTLYPSSAYGGSASTAFGALGTDLTFACNSRLSARAMSPLAPKAFVYEFADEQAPELFLPPLAGVPVYGAAHASELQYLWSIIDPASPGTLTADQMALSAAMVTYWTTFAKTGDPNGGTLPTWPAYTTTADSILTLAPGAGNVAPTTAFATAHNCAALQLD